jgi:uncharacterized protein
MSFARRMAHLPRLGLGVSTEYGASSATSLDVHQLRRDHPEWAGFLELGVEQSKGLDDSAQRWVAAGWPTTYHFLDINLDDHEDFDDMWLTSLSTSLAAVRPAWLCGDAGMWHFGVRDRHHMLLLPPILERDAADDMARGVARLREATGFEVLPENPPGAAFIGDLHILEFFAHVCSQADSGMLLDAAHLAMFQRSRGLAPTTGLDAFPMERIVEVHVAGGTVRDIDGLRIVEDSHSTEVLDDTWTIVDHLLCRCPHLKAVVFECERNQNELVTAGFSRLSSLRWWP